MPLDGHHHSGPPSPRWASSYSARSNPDVERAGCRRSARDKRLDPPDPPGSRFSPSAPAWAFSKWPERERIIAPVRQQSIETFYVAVLTEVCRAFRLGILGVVQA